jgi:hypothetical protein
VTDFLCRILERGVSGAAVVPRLASLYEPEGQAALAVGGSGGARLSEERPARPVRAAGPSAAHGEARLGGADATSWAVGGDPPPGARRSAQHPEAGLVADRDHDQGRDERRLTGQRPPGRTSLAGPANSIEAVSGAVEAAAGAGAGTDPDERGVTSGATEAVVEAAVEAAAQTRPARPARATVAVARPVDGVPRPRGKAAARAADGGAAGDDRRSVGELRPAFVVPVSANRQVSPARLTLPVDESGSDAGAVINVTIGRIEVRAIAAPAPERPRRAAPGRRPGPLSLDDYLRQREQRR